MKKVLALILFVIAFFVIEKVDNKIMGKEIIGNREIEFSEDKSFDEIVIIDSKNSPILVNFFV